MENFKQQLLSTLEELCQNEGTRITTTQVIKPNNTELTAICLSPEDCNIGRNYYLEDLFQHYQSGQTIIEIANNIMKHNKNDSTFTKCSVITSFVAHSDSYDFIKNHLIVRLLNLKENSKYLANKIYFPYLPTDDSYELAICLGIHVPEINNSYGIISVTNKLRNNWNVTDEELLKQALANTEEKYGYQVRSMYDVIQKLAGDTYTYDFSEYMNAPEASMFVMTNDFYHYGAATILYQKPLKEFAEKMGHNLFIIPASTHEVILLPDVGNLSISQLQNMIIEVNQTELAPQDVLSNQLLYYSLTNNCVSICKSTERD